MRRYVASGAGLPGIPFFLLAAFLLVLGAGAAWADSLSSWYASDPRAAPYQGVRDELEQVFLEARQQHVPARLFLDRLYEGSAKKVAPQRLVEALHNDLSIFSRASQIVARAGGPRALLPRPTAGMVKEVGIYLRAGLPGQLVSQLLAAGGGRQRGTELALAACGAIMDLRAVAPLADADSLQIGKLLMTSGMQPSGYASLALVYGLGRSRGLSPDNLVHDIIINTLSSGGGVAIMNKKIQSTSLPVMSPPPARPRRPSRHYNARH